MAVNPASIAQPMRRKAKLWDRVYPYVSTTIPFLVIALFTIYPVLYAVRISFYQYILTKPKAHPFVGLKNFVEVITSYYFRTSLIKHGVVRACGGGGCDAIWGGGGNALE